MNTGCGRFCSHLSTWWFRNSPPLSLSKPNNEKGRLASTSCNAASVPTWPRPHSRRTAPPYRPPASPLYLPPTGCHEWESAAATTFPVASATGPSLDPATVPAIGPASARWPVRASPAPPRASAARVARRRESTRATSPPSAGHTHSPWPARLALARAPTAPAHTPPDDRSQSPDRSPPSTRLKPESPICDDIPATPALD